MPKGPKGQKRPADVIGNAVKVMRIATGEETEELDKPKNRTGSEITAAEMGKKGGLARAKKLTSAQRIAIAKQAARKRWGET
jgi:hypothetical protein